MKRREILLYGYRAFTGKRWTDSQVDRYNAIQARINSFLDEGLPVPESLLDESHKAFSMFSGCYT